MKKSRRVLAVLLCAVMVTAIAPAVSVSAESCSGTCGENLTWALDTAAGVLTISGTGEMEYYSYYDASPWYSRREEITSIIIDAGVTGIGVYAFYDCVNLVSVTIPSTVTDIGLKAFENCDALENVYISDLAAWCNVWLSSSESNPMYYAENLYINGVLTTEIVIPDGVTQINDRVFEQCTAITSITIPDSVTSIGFDAFYNTAYYSNAANWEDGVLYIGKHLIDAEWTIAGDYSIKSGTLTIADSAFSRCSYLTGVTIPNSVTKISASAFFDCGRLVNVDIPASVNSIGEFAFAECSNLTSVTIPNSVKSIGMFAFELCSSLTNVTIPDSVTSIGEYAFLYSGYYEDETNWEDGVLYIGKHLIKADEMIEGDYEIKSGTLTIADYAFEYCEELTGVIIPGSVVSIGNYSFYGSGITSAEIAEGVTSIGEGAF